MTILAAAHNMSGFEALVTGGTLASVTTGVATHTPWYTSIARNGAAAYSFQITPSSSFSEGWAHFSFYSNLVLSIISDLAPITFTSGGVGVLRVLNTNGIPSLQGYNGSSWSTLTPSLDRSAFGLPSVINVRMDVDVHIKIADSGGIFELFCNGFPIMTFYGDTKLGSLTSCDRVDFQSPSTATASVALSEIIIADTTTIGMKLYSALLNATGTYSEWTSGTYTNVDEEGIYSDADVMNSATAGQRQGINVASVPSGSMPTHHIHAVGVTCRAQYLTGAPTKLGLGLRSNSTDYYSSDKTLTTAYVGYRSLWTTDPNTSAEWTESAFSSLEVLVRSAT